MFRVPKKKNKKFLKKVLTFSNKCCIIYTVDDRKLTNAVHNSGTHGGIAQLARAFGSYPKCRWFKSDCRYHNGLLVKRLRHRPFTAVTRVRFSYRSPYGSLAQLGEHLPYKQRVSGSSPLTSTKHR